MYEELKVELAAVQEEEPTSIEPEPLKEKSLILHEEKVGRESAGPEGVEAKTGEEDVEDLMDLLSDDDHNGVLLLSTREVEQKKKLWTHMNRSWLQDQVQKRNLEAASGTSQRPKKKKKTESGGVVPSVAGNAADAAFSMAKEKQLSKKIDYEKLKQLFKAEDRSQSQEINNSVPGDSPMAGDASTNRPRSADRADAKRRVRRAGMRMGGKIGRKKSSQYRKRRT